MLNDSSTAKIDPQFSEFMVRHLNKLSALLNECALDSYEQFQGGHEGFSTICGMLRTTFAFLCMSMEKQNLPYSEKQKVYDFICSELKKSLQTNYAEKQKTFIH